MRVRIYSLCRKIFNAYSITRTARSSTNKMVDRGRCVEPRQTYQFNVVDELFVISRILWFVLFRSFSNFACDLSFVDERVRSHAPVDSMTPLPMNWIPDNSSVICGRGRDAYNHSTLLLRAFVGQVAPVGLIFY